MGFDANFLPYPSTRYPVIARGGMVAASSPQAAAAGLDALRRGGNAADAAVATAAALTVTEPTANGIGADAFALVWMEGEKKLYGLNASGYSPYSLTLEKAREAAHGSGMPAFGWLPVMVPGAPAAWAALSGRYGRLSMADSMSAAIDYADKGYPVSPCLSLMWRRAAQRYAAFQGDGSFGEWFRTFLPEGRDPETGDVVRLPDHAGTLKLIAESRSEAFYRGELAERIVRDSEAFGGFLGREDLSDYAPEWVEPISVQYRGYDVCEIPPNGQGIVALMALNILKEFQFPEKECADTFHRQWEAMKIAFADGKAYVTDPRTMAVDARALISPAYGALRVREIGDTAALPMPGQPSGSGTVYFCTADGEGNMVSFIQSNYMGFGSGIVVRGTGIALQNRGHDFRLTPRQPTRSCLTRRATTPSSPAS